MKKQMGKIIGVLVMSALLTGCGSKDIQIDVNALGNDLNTQIEYQDELMQIDADMAAMFLNLSELDIVNCAIYEGSGATAEEIVVIECADESNAKNAQNVLSERVAEQKESFTDYVPEEIPKLDSAVIRICGKYAILSVSGDAKKAQSIIDGYTK